ncbi:MAG: right-handed parallel beta-helix repeat-containing protein [Planctomycetota bacterium]|jgi:parallel beta-helix repeat protein
MKKAAILLMALAAAAPAAPRTITVDDDNPADFTTIQAAIDDANNGDIVLIHPGTYTGPGNRYISFRGKPITVTSTDPNNPEVVAATVIDCLSSDTLSFGHKLYRRAFNFDENEGPTSVLAGITIINGGRWDDGSTTPEKYHGGAISCVNSSPTITHCNITQNSAKDGGAIWLESSSPTITNCTITENVSNWGGAIYSKTGRFGTTGRPAITNCNISNNTSGHGGAICIYDDNARIHNCLIAHNSTRNSGGGIYLLGSRSTISGCTIIDNTAEYGGGIYCRNVETQIQNCIVSGNTAQIGPQIFAATDFITTVLHSNVQGGLAEVFSNNDHTLVWGPGNIDTDPLFVNPSELDYHLQPASPCIDAGDPNYISILGETDIDSEPRVMGISIDMGYDETTASPTPVIGLSTTAFAFKKVEGEPEPNDLNLLVYNAGYGELSWVIANSAPWLALDSSAGTSTGETDTVTLSVNTAGLAPGDYHSELIITADGASNSPTTLFVTMIIRRSGTAIEIRVPSEYNTIQAAIDAALDGDTVIIADGVYTGEGNRDITFRGKAITVRSENAPTDCTINCQAAHTDPHRGFIFQDTETGDSVLQGLTIINAFTYKGAAIYCVDSSPRIKNCIFENNSASNEGGAVANTTTEDGEHCAPVFDSCIFRSNFAAYGGAVVNTSSDSTFVDCQFTDNVASLDGGATDDTHNLATYNTCIFLRNSAGDGGAMRMLNGAHAVLVNCIFSGNAAYQHGGAIQIYRSTPIITNCLFTLNTAFPLHPTGKAWGGAIDNYHQGAPKISGCDFIGNSSKLGGAINNWFNANLTVRNCRFAGNSAHDEGGAVRSDGLATITNSVLAGNVALKGAGVFGSERDDHSVTNCLFYANVAREDGGGLYYVAVAPGLNLKNCILWDNIPQQIYASDSPPVITHSDIQAGYPGQGNIDADPCFADPGYWDPNETPEDPNDDFWVDGDYHLKSQAGRYNPNTAAWVIDQTTSPCIDAGNPAGPIGHEPFPNGGIINMGAYGGTPEASKSYFGDPPCQTIVTGDINGDCKVNFNDFQLMAQHWSEQND